MALLGTGINTFVDLPPHSGSAARGRERGKLQPQGGLRIKKPRVHPACRGWGARRFPWPPGSHWLNWG